MLELRRVRALFRLLWKKYTKKQLVRRVGWGVIFFLATLIIVGSGFSSGKLSFREGQVSPTNIYAPRANSKGFKPMNQDTARAIIAALK